MLNMKLSSYFIKEATKKLESKSFTRLDFNIVINDNSSSLLKIEFKHQSFLFKINNEHPSHHPSDTSHEDEVSVTMTPGKLTLEERWKIPLHEALEKIGDWQGYIIEEISGMERNQELESEIRLTLQNSRLNLNHSSHHEYGQDERERILDSLKLNISELINTTPELSEHLDSIKAGINNLKKLSHYIQLDIWQKIAINNICNIAYTLIDKTNDIEKKAAILETLKKTVTQL